MFIPDVQHSPVPVVVPERTVAQRREALDRANEVRVYRADMKARIKADPSEAAREFEEPSPLVATMKVYDLLRAVPSFGRVKVETLLRREMISPSKTVGGLSKRQRNTLLMVLAARGIRSSVRDAGTMTP